MTAIIEARGLSKSFGANHALDDVSFSIEHGRIVGLIGPNGAGKTTAIKAILGLTPFQGELQVLGLDPRTQRDELMRDVCFMADVAVLPRWLRVQPGARLLQPACTRASCARAPRNSCARPTSACKSRVRELSKGMVTQLHLALILAIDARLLVLDEPTLGLDLLYRRQFYDTLLNDYFDKDRTILLTTHQVEEVENLFTDVIFISRGQLALKSSGRGTRQPLPAAHRERRAGRPGARAQALLRARGVRPRRHVLRGAHGRRARPARGAAHALDRRPVRGQDAGDDEVMNSTTANAAPRSDLTVQQPLKLSTTLATLVRREFWEHPALWRAPLIIAGAPGRHVRHRRDHGRAPLGRARRCGWDGT